MIAAALLEQGKDVTDDVLPVDVWPAATSYRAAFSVLSAARGQGMNGWNALAYSEVVAYAEQNGHAGTIDELEEFVSLIQAQDCSFLECAAKARDAK